MVLLNGWQDVIWGLVDSWFLARLCVKRREMLMYDSNTSAVYWKVGMPIH